MRKPARAITVTPRSWSIGVAFAALATPALLAALATLDTRGFLQVPALATLLAGAALPYLALALVAWRAPRAGGWVALGVSLPVLLALGAALAIGGDHALGVAVYFAPALGVPALFLLVAQLGLAAGGLAAARGVERGRGAFAWTMALALAVGLLGCIANASRWLGSSERHAVAALARGIDAHEAMLAAHRCLRLHHAAQGAYPDTLAGLGACLPPTGAGFALTYVRRGDGFELAAVTDDPATRESYSRTSDESGALFIGTTRRSGQEALPGMTRELVAAIDLCVEQYRLAHPDRGYPRSLAAPDAEGFPCFAGTGLGERMRSVVAIGETEGYRYGYTPAPPDASGRVASFRLDVRPVAWGRGLTRSWLCTPEGTLHATDEDRAAEHSDPDEQADALTGVARRTHCLGPDVPARLGG